MVQNITRHPKRTDEEWIQIIKDCRNSGMSDKAWCELHQLYPSNFYYHIRRLRNQICDLPESSFSTRKEPRQEIVQLQLKPDIPLNHQTNNSMLEVSPTSPALRININGFHVEIYNKAASETIYHTLSVLQSLC